ncbi:hypothetical protein BD626DRAFT_150312 [Schizophyllum amplum]|uniref:Uncharacterized protein n=1 Tax=Schizophyllum amplum TaxID=97359 RepID=A0A550C409_9AGAR|nr:hypothetical protein BD626DRAFT_150312 [Auriculariopsis ampla]
MFSWGAAKAPPSASNTRIPAPPPPTRQSRIRELWAGFEQWHGQAKGAADAKRVEAFRTLDKQHKSNKKNKLSKAEQEKAKEQKGREIDIELVTTARDEWQRRLGEAGFRAEDWDDMSVAETRAVERLLGDGQDVEGQAAAAAASAASSPLAGFAFVNPKALSDDEGEDAKKNIPTRVRDLPNPHLPPAPSDAALWNHTIPGYANWGIDSAASSAVSLSTIPLPSSAHSSTPSSARTSPSSGHVPLPPSFSFHAITASSASAAAATSSRPHKHRNVRYVGPVLAEEAHSEEEEEFEEFKIQVRINKILEFHDAAAQEDIQLAIKVLQARKEHKRRGTDRGRRRRRSAL